MTGKPSFRLAHGWRLTRSDAAGQLVRSWIRPAVRAVPEAIAALLPSCAIHVEARIDQRNAASAWRLRREFLDITVATEGVAPHDIVLEMLICIGQTLWDLISADECAQWLQILQLEISDAVSGEIDEQALDEKRKLLSSAVSARSRRRLADYARASFAGTAAEYVHCLWHDVGIRTGPEHLPARYLRTRLELMERWFPPNPGYRLFPERHSAGSGYA